MRTLLIIVGFGFYTLSVFLILFYKPNAYESEYFKLVNEDAYNYLYTYLAAVVLSIIGTGFIILSTISSDNSSNIAKEFAEMLQSEDD